MILKLFSKKIASKCCKWENNGYNIKAMLKYTAASRYNTTIVDTSYNFVESLQYDIINDCARLGILTNGVIDDVKFFKRIFNHYIITYICDLIVHETISGYILFYINTAVVKKSEINNYLVDISANDYISNIFKSMQTLLGINYIISDVKFDTFINDIEKQEGDSIELLLLNNSKKPKNLIQIKKYMSDNGLSQLLTNFENDLTYKRVLI